MCAVEHLIDADEEQIVGKVEARQIIADRNRHAGFGGGAGAKPIEKVLFGCHYFAFGVSSRFPYSCQLASYTATFPNPRSFSTKYGKLTRVPVWQ